MDSNAALCETIAHRIASSSQRRITFAEYMDIVLYHSDHGYYATNKVNIGFQDGDFFTSPHLGNDFGELLAEQLLQFWQILGRPVPFSLIEIGAGQGILALHISNYLQQQYSDFFAALEYVIVEKSPALKKEQQQCLQDFPVRWSTLEEIPSNSITGCFFSNELVDALPVNQFILKAGKLQEIYVTMREDRGWENDGVGERESKSSFSLSSDSLPYFVEVTGEPSTPQLAQYFDLVKIKFRESDYSDGYRSEVNLAALDWLSLVADRLQRGYLLTIDYGYPANRYYNPMRSQGTLQCYYRHRHHNNPYINVGRQDITAHVDFTALERWGERCGLYKLGFTKQEVFLMALGIGDRLANISHQEQPISQLLQRRSKLHQLIDPMGLGRFGVLLQSKGLTHTEATQPLKGWTMPN